MTSYQDNPLVLVYDALWDCLEAYPLLDTLVKTSNRIRFDQDKSGPLKSNIQHGDLPEIVLVSEGGSANTHASSCHAKLVRQYAWMVSTGDFRINRLLYQAEWAVFSAMINYTSALSALTWFDEHFVKRTDLLDITEGVSDAEKNRGIQGWSSVWRCEVEMFFPHAHVDALPA